MIPKFKSEIARDLGVSSLDFLPRHEHYKSFAKLTQDERFEKCKGMFLDQYDDKQKKT